MQQRLIADVFMQVSVLFSVWEGAQFALTNQQQTMSNL